MNTKLSEEVVRKIKSIGAAAIDDNTKDFSLGEIPTCPQCGNQAITGGGTFLSAGFKNVPLKFKILFISVTLGLSASVAYCPKCGFLSLKLA